MLAYLKELGPELLKSLFEIDTIEVILDDDSTRVQRMGASGWLLLSVFPVSKVKKILKNAKLAKKTGKAGNVIQLTEKELAILKKYAEPLLQQIGENEPEYDEAQRLLNFIQPFEIIEDESAIPNNSILREFIGGSVFVE